MWFATVGDVSGQVRRGEGQILMGMARKAGRAFERFLGVFDVMAGYGTRRGRRPAPKAAARRR
jgi:hypothetical protein